MTWAAYNLTTWAGCNDLGRAKLNHDRNGLFMTPSEAQIQPTVGEVMILADTVMPPQELRAALENFCMMLRHNDDRVSKLHETYTREGAVAELDSLTAWLTHLPTIDDVDTFRLSLEHFIGSRRKHHAEPYTPPEVTEIPAPPPPPTSPNGKHGLKIER